MKLFNIVFKCSVMVWMFLVLAFLGFDFFYDMTLDFSDKTRMVMWMTTCLCSFPFVVTACLILMDKFTGED